MIIIQINNTPYLFQEIKNGTFIMGANDFMSNAAPPHEVCITQNFFMLETCVTQRLWFDIMGTDIHYQRMLKATDILYGVGEDLPMYYINWYEVNAFIKKFNEVLQATHLGLKASLPTEAQWEYACRAGTHTPYSWGDGLNGTQANCNGLYPYGIYEEGPFIQKVLLVKAFAPNSWGLYEMHGNVWEWCLDNYSPTYYQESSSEDPQGPKEANHKVIRGGGWRSFAWCCRSAFRDSDPPEYRGRTLGFRLILIAK